MTMYLLPLLSEKKEFVRTTISKRRMGLTQNALFGLAGYSYYNKQKNQVGILPTDHCSNVLDLYDPPPRTDVIMERILKAVSARESKLSNSSCNYEAKCSHTKRASVSSLTVHEWKAWLLDGNSELEEAVTKPYDQTSYGEQCSSNQPCINKTIKDTSNVTVDHVLGVTKCPVSDSDTTESPKKKSFSPNLQPSGANDNCSPSPNDHISNDAEDKTAKLRSSTVSAPKSCTKNKKSIPKRGRGRKYKQKQKTQQKVMCESLGRKIYVNALPRLQSQDASTDDNDQSDYLSSETGNSDNESDSTSGSSCNDSCEDTSYIPYGLLEEKHYTYDPDHSHDDNKNYYKGYQHLCLTRKNTCSQREAYSSQTAKDSFTDQSFATHFGSPAVDDKGSSTQATTSPLNRFQDSNNNPIVGTKDMALSDEIVQSILRIANSKPFLQGKDSYVRAATSDPCNGFRVPPFPPQEQYQKEVHWDRMYPVMRIGQREDGSARIYKGVEASLEEENLMRMVNSFVQEVLGEGFPCDHNMMMMVVSSMDYSFGGHSDHSIWHGKLDVNCTYRSKTGVPLPSEQDSFTLTMVITNSRTTKGAIDVSWYDKTTADSENINGRLLYRCTTTNNFVHFQLPGTQSHGIIHAGSTVKNPEAAVTNNVKEMADSNDISMTDWRIVISFRQNVCSSYCPACYLKRFDLLNMHKCQLIGAIEKDWLCNILESIEEGNTPPIYDGDLQPYNGHNHSCEKERKPGIVSPMGNSLT